jgi:CubicO group peptidase (beta-lactamase class C family)
MPTVNQSSANETPEFPDAEATDPSRLGWMVGSPPAADKLIRYEDGSYYRFPQWRWSFSHWRSLRPTIEVSRGPTTVRELQSVPRNMDAELEAVTFTPLNNSTQVTWGDSLAANYTDGILVLHRGRIAYERYFGALTAERSHIAFSVTKSFFGTLAAVLIDEGALDAGARVSRYIPELERSGFGDATVSEVLDMTTAIDFAENYVGGSESMLNYGVATGFRVAPPAHAGAKSVYEFLPTIGKAGGHGEAFTYRTPNTDVVGWLIARAARKSPVDYLSDRVWRHLGAEEHAYMQVDEQGTALAGLSLNMRLRDLARFGEMMRMSGRFNDRQIIPAAVVEDIRRGGSREAFKKAAYATLPGWSYRRQWWVSHDDHGVFMARGIHGQAIYVDPKAEMVIARFASHPLAGNSLLDPMSLPAYRAVADYFLQSA